MHLQVNILYQLLTHTVILSPYILQICLLMPFKLQLLQDMTNRLTTFLPYLEVYILNSRMSEDIVCFIFDCIRNVQAELNNFSDAAEPNIRFFAMLCGPLYPILHIVNERFVQVTDLCHTQCITKIVSKETKTPIEVWFSEESFLFSFLRYRCLCCFVPYQSFSQSYLFQYKRGCWATSFFGFRVFLTTVLVCHHFYLVLFPAYNILFSYQKKKKVAF